MLCAQSERNGAGCFTGIGETLTLALTLNLTLTLSFPLQVPGCGVGGEGDISNYDYCFEITAGAQCDEARVSGRVRGRGRVIAGSSCDMRYMNFLSGNWDALL